MLRFLKENKGKNDFHLSHGRVVTPIPAHGHVPWLTRPCGHVLDVLLRYDDPPICPTMLRPSPLHHSLSSLKYPSNSRFFNDFLHKCLHPFDRVLVLTASPKLKRDTIKEIISSGNNLPIKPSGWVLSFYKHLSKKMMINIRDISSLILSRESFKYKALTSIFDTWIMSLGDGSSTTTLICKRYMCVNIYIYIYMSLISIYVITYVKV